MIGLGFKIVWSKCGENLKINNKEMALTVPPEGGRGRGTTWKTCRKTRGNIQFPLSLMAKLPVKLFPTSIATSREENFFWKADLQISTQAHDWLVVYNFPMNGARDFSQKSFYARGIKKCLPAGLAPLRSLLWPRLRRCWPWPSPWCRAPSAGT